jgi:hypothetical protein
MLQANICVAAPKEDYPGIHRIGVEYDMFTPGDNGAQRIVRALDIPLESHVRDVGRHDKRLLCLANARAVYASAS